MYQLTEFDKEILEFTEKEISAGNPEVINSQLLSDFGRMCSNNQPRNQDIEVMDSPVIIDRFPDKFHELDSENQMSNFREETAENIYDVAEETGPGNIDINSSELLCDYGSVGADIQQGNQCIQMPDGSENIDNFIDKFPKWGIVNQKSISNDEVTQNIYSTSEETASVNAEKDSSKPFNDYGSIFGNNQQIQVNPENICHTYDTISNDEQVLNNTQCISGYSNNIEIQIPTYDRLQTFESRITGCNTHMSSRTRSHLVHNETEMDNKNHIHNRKRNLSNYRVILDDSLPHKIIRSENMEMSGQVSEACNDMGVMINNLWIPHSTTNQVSLQKNCLVNIDHQFQSSTCSDKGSANYDIWLPKSVANQMKNQHNNVVNVDHKFHTIEEPSAPNQRMLTLDTEGKKVNLTLGQTTASNSCMTEITQKVYKTTSISDAVASEKETVYCGANIVAIPGPSGSIINKKEVYVSGELFNRILKKEKALACGVCKKEITKHKSAQKGNIFYGCCICTYNTCKKVELQMHSNYHYPKLFCNKCEIFHKEGDSHDTEHQCLLCEKPFQCRTKLKEHCEEHEDYFKTHCKLCCGVVDDHFIKEEDHFVCCICGYENKYKTEFRRHTYRHFSKIFCNICSEEYLEAEEGLHGSGYTCYVCNKKFQCKIQLEQHSVDQDEYCFKFCKLCTEEIRVHFSQKETETLFGCCCCSINILDENIFQAHLLAHKDLRLFKCCGCGRRFKNNIDFHSHSRYCLDLLYRCKKCNSKFPRRDFLVAHYSVRHRQQ